MPKLILPKPHKGQQEVIDNMKRFTALNCGRRWGKTTFGTTALAMPAVRGYPVGWYSPTYKDLSEIWKFVKNMLEPVIKNKNEQLKQIELTTGGIIDFWSLDNIDSSRGRKYKRIVVDEVAMIKQFMDAWRQTLLPTLLDFEGDALLLSTPKGKANDWYKICQSTGEEWSVFNMPTWTNPYITEKAISDIKAVTPQLEFLQEYAAQFISLNGSPFLYEFKEAKHVTKKKQEVDPFEPLWISFDFNIDPTSAIIAQYLPGRGFYVHKSFQVKGGTDRLCDALIEHGVLGHVSGLKVTGDFSGNTGSSAAGMSGGEYNTDYSIISDRLQLGRYDLIDTRTANKRHVFSRGLCNAFLMRLPVFINEYENEALIREMENAQTTESGKLLKNRLTHPNDLLDAFRYWVNAICPQGRESINNYAYELGIN